MELSKIIDANKILIKYVGVLTIIIGLILLLPLLMIIVYPQEIKCAIDFLIPGVVAITLGFLMTLFSKNVDDVNLTVGQDGVIVVMVWIIASLISALPFMISGQLNFTQAVFEAVSGWTTTGLSVVNVEVTPHVFIIFRSLMQFFGGVGLILVMLSALSATFGLRLYTSEGHADRLMPNLVSSSRLILSIYFGYTIAGTILYVIFGMPLFDAINHSIAALSTGGFSTKTESIGAYHSLSIELITIILMILGTTNFAAHLLLIRGKFKKFLKIGEIKFMFVLMGIFIPIVSFIGLKGIYENTFDAIRITIFQIVSALSTTGFSTISFNDWNSFSIFVIIILMIIGGGAGSTAGGIKLYRVYLVVKSSLWSVHDKFKSPNTVKEHYVIKPDGKFFVNDSHIIEAYNYAFIYLLFLIIGTGIMALYGYPLRDSLFEFASSIGTVGLSIGITSPNTPDVVLWTQIFGMLFGRLEILVIFVAFIKIIRDIREIVIEKNEVKNNR